MLTEEERKEIDLELEQYQQKKFACIGALKAVQRHRGWVSDDGVRDVAEYLEMTPHQVDSVATFYNLIFRKPVGRHVILICDSISCWITGFDRIRDRITQVLGIRPGETTADGEFTLLPMVCLGDCDHAPVMMIDDDLHRDLTPESVEEILKKYRREQP